MSSMHSNAGLSLIEVMVAVVILTIGLSGVALMQTKALRGIQFAGSFSTGSNAALTWLEWFNKYINQEQQASIYFNGTLQKEHFVRLSNLDTNPYDREFTQVEVPRSTEALLTAFANTYHFKKANGENFTAQQVPPPSPGGSRIIWRVAANVPLPELTTLEVGCLYNTAFVSSQGVRLRMVFSDNM